MLGLGPVREWTWLEWMCAVLVLLCAAMIVSLPFLIAASMRERQRLLDEGCSVVDKRTTWMMQCSPVGKVVTCHQIPITHEAWKCPDGRMVER